MRTTLLRAGLALVCIPAAFAAERAPVDPDFRTVIDRPLVTEFAFDGPDAVWPALNQCSVSASGGVLRVESTGNDPYLRIPLPPVAGPLEVRWRMRTLSGGPAQFFWWTAGSPAFHSITVETQSDGQWHDYSAVCPETRPLTSFRIDPSTAPGPVEIAGARIARRVLHPLRFESLDADGSRVRAAVRNDSAAPVAFTAAGRPYCAASNGVVAFEVPVPAAGAFPSVTVEIRPDGFPPLAHTTYLHRPDVPFDGVEFGAGDLRVRVARDGSGARWFRKGRPAGFASPLVQCDGAAVPLRVVREDANGVELAGGPVERLAFRVEGGEIRIELRARETVTGPSIRLAGTLEQGLLAGVEHLGHGEASSTTLDLEGPARVRYEPDPMLLTMPLAAFVTPEASLAVLWDDPENLRPVFSVPNRYDGTADQLAALRGRAMNLRVRPGDGFASGGRLEDAILWAVRARGLPPVPPRPRSAEEQRKLSLQALTVTMCDSNGWYHSKTRTAHTAFLADHASSLWRLTGEAPVLPSLQWGGAHVRNDASWFVTGRATQWIAHLRATADAARRSQQPDGSYRYGGEFRRGHFEDTASGLCALRVAPLLDAAEYLGDTNALAAAVRTLDYMRRFRTPRGAQTWEIPLHTPDIYGAGALVAAYVRGFQLTGRREYLDLARRWALSGMPFVYQWGNRPVMPYATIAVLGATDWASPVWIGLPVQWCGTVYAHALLRLAPLDASLDWRRVAEGILVAAEQMQYPDGEHAGALPDSFSLGSQARRESAVNPCVLVALRLLVDGRLDALSVAADDRHRVVAPFPVALRGGRAVVEGAAGTRYQAVIDGVRVVDVESRGRDEIVVE